MLEVADILAKYDVAGPRYTSYPTVPAWTDAVGENDYLKALASIAPNDSLSLYFHLPFCEKLCHFCGCFKIITPEHARSAPYVETLLGEIELVAERLGGRRPVTQIHCGGGTPNFLQPEEIAALMARVRKYFNVLPGAEIAIEMHPRTTTHAFCDHLKREGFNRISLGVQDFDDVVQKLINRFQTFAMTRDMVDDLRALGFDSFNFDLIYGLPGQTLERFRETLALTLTLKPNRMAVYSYAHVPWKSPVQRSFRTADLPPPERRLALFAAAHAFFTANGYRQIGMDHFALKDDELSRALDHGGLHRNFMGYSTRADAHQLGFGISSISFAAGNYFQNAKTIAAYESGVKSGHLPIMRGFLLSPDDRIRRDIILDIMCRLRVDFAAFGARHGIDFKAYFHDALMGLKPFVHDGLVEIHDAGFRVTETGKLTLRNIAMCFDAYLDTIREGAKNPVFSRTV